MCVCVCVCVCVYFPTKGAFTILLFLCHYLNFWETSLHVIRTEKCALKCVHIWSSTIFRIRTILKGKNIKVGRYLHALGVIGEGNGTPLQYSCLENPMGRGTWGAAVHGVTKSRTWPSDFTFTFHFHALGKEMATHSSVLAWRIPGMGEPGGLPSMGSHRVGDDWSDLAAAAASQ